MTRKALVEPLGATSFPTEEARIAKYWEEKDCFKKSVQLSEGKKRYVFYDGPPFATGLPHYGHILAGTIKDVVCRYAHQTGHHVERRFGWDCHGLPIEFEIEKELGIKSKAEIEKMGIRAYNAKCREIVMKYATEWESQITRLGRWIDFKNDYKTMDLTYMESAWWGFNQLWEKGLVYRGVKIMPYSTGCTTPLSNFEAGMDYREVKDPAVVVNFPTVEDNNTCFLAWTTTPWTLPSNVGLCVHPDFTYVKVKDEATGKNYILLESRLTEVYPTLKVKKGEDPKPETRYEVLEKMEGKALKGTRYVPLFDYFAADTEARGYFQVMCDTYVTEGSGTGVVHNAPGFGADDYRVCQDVGMVGKELYPPCPIDAEGKFEDVVSDYKGIYVKDADDAICAKLKADGRLVSKGSIGHNYPFCWRSDTPLLYKCVSSWFINVEKIKEQLIECTAQTHWEPDFVKSKRFQNWIEDAQDWCVSRSRYWGLPLPIWQNKQGEKVCIKSAQDLSERSGQEVTDLHRENIDDITIPSKEGGDPLRRVPEVFDCWFESGSMPHAQSHYPFEENPQFSPEEPADFIAEGLDQTRGWFYTMLVLSTAIFGRPAFKHVVVNGLILASDGKKMSKRLRNYPPPMELVDSHTADAIRMYLMTSPAVRAEPLKFSEAGVKDIIRDVHLPLWNATKFFIQNYNRYLEQGGDKDLRGIASDNVTDQWMRANAANFNKEVREEMDSYKLFRVLPRVQVFIDDLTKWYVRMNRRRLKGSEGTEEWEASLSTLYDVLMEGNMLLCAFMPFLTELIYERLSPLLPEDQRMDSVHHLMIPEVNSDVLSPETMRKMTRLQEVVDLVRVARDRSKLPLRKPVERVIVVSSDEVYLEDIRGLVDYLRLEVNALNVEFSSDEDKYVNFSAMANTRLLGKALGSQLKTVSAEAKKLTHEQVRQFMKDGKLTVGGVELEGEGLVVNRTPKKQEDGEFAANGNNAATVMVDTREDDNLMQLLAAREFTSFVQSLRKTANLHPSDQIEVVFRVLGDMDEMPEDPPTWKVEEALEANKEFVNTTLANTKWRAAAEGEDEFANAIKVTKGKDEVKENIVGMRRVSVALIKV